MESIVYRGGESFKGLLGYMGEVRMRNGGRIITNTNQNGDWKKVYYASTYGEIYVMKQQLEETIKDSASYIDYDSDWPRSWKGEKYVNFKLAYEGQFYFMMKHTDKEKAREYTQSNEGLEVFNGSFKYDKKHTKQNQSDELHIIKEGKVIDKLIGTWNNDKKHGQFAKKAKELNQQIVKKYPKIKKMSSYNIFYFNDVQVSQNRKPKTQKQAIKQFENDFNIGITLQGIRSLKQHHLLFSETLDFFFKHLSFSFQKYQQKNKNMKAYTVFNFQRMIPSNKVSAQRKNKVSINYEALKWKGQVYENLISIFEANPLILMPLNRDQSHFALGAISSHIVRDKNQKLQDVKFDLYYLDSLHNTQECVPQILRQYILQQIKQNMVLSEQQKIKYYQAANTAKPNNKTLVFSRQNNETDCGVFTCIYGFLLTIEVCSTKKYQIRWNWDIHEKEEDSLSNWIRKLIQKDAYLGIPNYFQLIESQFVKRKIMKISKFKMSDD